MAIKEIAKNAINVFKEIPSDLKWYVGGVCVGAAGVYLIFADSFNNIKYNNRMLRRLEYYDAVTKTNSMLMDLNAPYMMEVEFEDNEDAILKLKEISEADK